MEKYGIKDYCSQNDGDCQSCSLVNYGRDCRNNLVNEYTIMPETVKSISNKIKLLEVKIQRIKFLFSEFCSSPDENHTDKFNSLMNQLTECEELMKELQEEERKGLRH